MFNCQPKKKKKQCELTFQTSIDTPSYATRGFRQTEIVLKIQNKVSTIYIRFSFQPEFERENDNSFRVFISFILGAVNTSQG